MKRYLIILLSVVSITACAQKKKKEEGPDVWTNIEEAQKKNAEKPKKIMIDAFTDWCGWCKKMDASTFQDPEIKKYLAEHFYPVKLDAETPEDITFNGTTYKNQNPGKSRSAHDFALMIMNNRPSYPTLIFIDEKLNIITPVAGYLEAKDLEPILHFIAEDHYKTMKWEDFRSKFVGKCK
jgi:thioredoxin-related protein